MHRRQAERAKLKVLLTEDMEDIEINESGLDQATENALGKESSDKLKAALSRIGGDLTQEGGYRFFRRNTKEREFETRWLDDAEWLKRFEGLL